MTLTVAIAAENDDVDAEVYLALLKLLLPGGVQRHATQRRFSGWKSVRHLGGPYLRDAADKGVRHALFAIDNDGGAKRAPEHESDHDGPAQAADKKGCRACWLAEALPKWWSADGYKLWVVVPVQTLETWLLCLRGHSFATSEPEQTYARPDMKKDFFGSPTPPSDERQKMALAQIAQPNALDILRQRRSFLHFESQLAGWL